MNYLREQYKKETGNYATLENSQLRVIFSADYVEWLEDIIKFRRINKEVSKNEK